MDKKIIFGGVLGLLFLGVLVWFLFFRKNPETGATLVVLPGGKKDDKKDDKKPTTTATTTIIYQNANANASGASANANTFPVKMGHPNKDVIKQIQGVLIALGKLPKGQDDGVWGQGTENALKAAGLPTIYNSQAEIRKVINTDISGQTSQIGEIKVNEKNNKMFKVGQGLTVNLRESAWGGSAKLGTYTSGNRMKGTGKYTINGTVTWIQVSPAGSYTKGWIHSDGLTEL